MAIHASFNSATGVLTETGDSNGNTITTSLDAGQILVNGGAVSIDGGHRSSGTIPHSEINQSISRKAQGRLQLGFKFRHPTCG